MADTESPFEQLVNSEFGELRRVLLHHHEPLGAELGRWFRWSRRGKSTDDLPVGNGDFQLVGLPEAKKG